MGHPGQGSDAICVADNRVCCACSCSLAPIGKRIRFHGLPALQNSSPELRTSASSNFHFKLLRHSEWRRVFGRNTIMNAQAGVLSTAITQNWGKIVALKPSPRLTLRYILLRIVLLESG